MCRLLAYRGDPVILGKLILEPEHSLIHQSYCATEQIEPTNGDGFGVAWYDLEIHPEPAVLRSVRPAWNERNILSVASKIKSSCIFAHIRKATTGQVSHSNCHPFQYKNLLFMHNGTVRGFSDLRRKLLAQLDDEIFNWIGGQTDSEHFFALFLSNYNLRNDTHDKQAQDPKDAALALEKTIAQMESMKQEVGITEPLILNLAITNGQWLIATKYITPNSGCDAVSLFYSEGHNYNCHDGKVQIAESGIGGGCFVLTSERLSADVEKWKAVPENSMVVVSKDLDVSIRPLL